MQYIVCNGQAAGDWGPTQSPVFVIGGTEEQEKVEMSYQERVIQITADTDLGADCVGAILVPDIALAEPGYIKTMTVSMEAHSKHEFFAMAQMAYYQYQDEELSIVRVDGPIRLEMDEVVEEISCGMVIYRDKEGELHVVLHEQLNPKKMLEATNRYCTRWVRLDI